MSRLYEEIRQSKPFTSRSHEAAVNIMRTADVLQHAVERAMSPFGISNEQFNVLRILRGAGNDGLPTLGISSRMISRSPNITRLLDKLISKKFARRIRSRQDRRVVLISITTLGLKMLERLDGVLDEVLQKFPRTTKVEMQTFLALLDRIRENLAVKTAKELSLEKIKD